MRLRFLVCFGVLSLTTACVGPTAQAGMGSFSKVSEPGISLPMAGPQGMGLRVKADLMQVGFGIHSEDLESSKTAVAALTEILEKACGRKPALDLVLTRLDGVEGDRQWFSALLRFDVGAEEDMWQRVALKQNIEKSLALLNTKPGGLGQGVIAFHSGPVQPGLKDPASHRPALLQQWAERLRAFEQAISNPQAPLAPADCATPGDVVVEPLCLCQVMVRLRVDCRLKAVK